MRVSKTVSRREVLGALAAPPLAAMLARVPKLRETAPVTFVLVHGAWHGGWCWRKVTPLLRAAGHDVHTPTLTGLGERAHLLRPEIDLTTHIEDIAGVLEYEDLQNVVLVGHSYAGMVITGVADALPERLARLIYLDAFLPEDGKSLQDYTAANLTQIADRRGDGWRVPPLGSARAFGVTHESDAAWVDRRLGHQPLKTFTQPVESSAAAASLPKVYVHCTRVPHFDDAAERAKAKGFRVLELFSGGHDVMISQPGELARLLTQLL